MKELKTTFWQDFSIADRFGEKAVRDTFDRAFGEWRTNTEYVTELVLVLNWKIWEHWEKGDEAAAKVYDELWKLADGWCMENLKGDDLRYFLAETD